jgi:hypothetical protein
MRKLQLILTVVLALSASGCNVFVGWFSEPVPRHEGKWTGVVAKGKLTGKDGSVDRVAILKSAKPDLPPAYTQDTGSVRPLTTRHGQLIPLRRVPAGLGERVRLYGHQEALNFEKLETQSGSSMQTLEYADENYEPAFYPPLGVVVHRFLAPETGREAAEN